MRFSAPRVIRADRPAPLHRRHAPAAASGSSSSSPRSSPRPCSTTPTHPRAAPPATWRSPATGSPSTSTASATSKKPRSPTGSSPSSFRLFGFNTFAAHLPQAIAVLLLALSATAGPPRPSAPHRPLHRPRHPHLHRRLPLHPHLHPRGPALPPPLRRPLRSSSNPSKAPPPGHSSTTRSCHPERSRRTCVSNATTHLLPYVMWTALALAVLTKGLVALVFFFGSRRSSTSLLTGECAQLAPPQAPPRHPPLPRSSPPPGTSSPASATPAAPTATASSGSTSSTSTSSASSAAASRMDYNKLPAYLFWTPPPRLALSLEPLSPARRPPRPPSRPHLPSPRRPLRHRHPPQPPLPPPPPRHLSAAAPPSSSPSTPPSSCSSSPSPPTRSTTPSPPTSRSSSSSPPPSPAPSRPSPATPPPAAGSPSPTPPSPSSASPSPSPSPTASGPRATSPSSPTSATSSPTAASATTPSPCRTSSISPAPPSPRSASPPPSPPLAFALGPAVAWLLRQQRRHLASTIAIALTSALFLIAAHIALVRFAPMLSSQDLADTIQELERDGSISRENQVLLYGDQAYGSSIPFYLGQQRRPRRRPLHLHALRLHLPRRPAHLPHLRRSPRPWGTGERKILFVPLESRDEVDRLLGNPPRPARRDLRQSPPHRPPPRHQPPTRVPQPPASLIAQLLSSRTVRPAHIRNPNQHRRNQRNIFRHSEPPP